MCLYLFLQHGKTDRLNKYFSHYPRISGPRCQRQEDCPILFPRHQKAVLQGSVPVHPLFPDRHFLLLHAGLPVPCQARSYPGGLRQSVPQGHKFQVSEADFFLLPMPDSSSLPYLSPALQRKTGQSGFFLPHCHFPRKHQQHFPALLAHRPYNLPHRHRSKMVFPAWLQSSPPLYTERPARFRLDFFLLQYRQRPYSS